MRSWWQTCVAYRRHVLLFSAIVVLSSLVVGGSLEGTLVAMVPGALGIVFGTVLLTIIVARRDGEL